ncbi:MAG: SDR family NAD(P)-dependent oxidoreductase [Dehalococcoidia bacterium]
MDRLKDKVVLVAGAGGRQGTAVPLLFAREGARVAPAGLVADELETIAQKIRAGGREAVVRASDLSDADEAEAAVRMAIDAFGRIDVLYNNTGIYTAGDARTADTDLNQWHQLLEVNLESHFLMAKFALREMVRRQSGAIINVAAARAARLGGNVGYAASKAAIIGITKKMAREYAADNIRVNCICPTNIQASPDPEDPRPPERKIARDGTPEDVAYAALFLASDESPWITRVELVVDGGAEVMG